MFVREREDAFAVFFFFNDTATTEIYTLSLHDALPIWFRDHIFVQRDHSQIPSRLSSEANKRQDADFGRDRKSTRLNSSHSQISYAVFCLKKKITLSTTALKRMTYDY